VGPELSTLRGDALRIWSDAGVRREALEAVVAAWDERLPDLEARVHRVDEAVVAGLRALGLPRGDVRGVYLEATGRARAGRKLADCRIVLDGDVMRHVVLVQRQPDRAFRTWIHESLHARRAYHPAASSEYLRHPGYEEGMVEGLARFVTRDMAGMEVGDVSYDYYVAAYRALSIVVGAEPQALWRTLWTRRAGEARAAFVDAVDEFRRGVGGERPHRASPGRSGGASGQ
jgi:hypothetical protein